MSFEIFLFLCSSLHFVQWSGTIWVILIDDLPRNNPVKFCWNPPSSYGGDVFSIVTSGRHFMQLERNSFNNFDRWPPKELSYQVWLKSAQWYRGDIFFFFFFSSCGYFVQRSTTICAILVEGLPSNNPIMFAWNLPSSYSGDVVWCLFFLFLALATILWCREGRFGQFW